MRENTTRHERREERGVSDIKQNVRIPIPLESESQPGREGEQEKARERKTRREIRDKRKNE
jgi:hypothetical protein